MGRNLPAEREETYRRHAAGKTVSFSEQYQLPKAAGSGKSVMTRLLAQEIHAYSE
jgi:hypothetical protein